MAHKPKYEHLKNSIPRQQTERSAAVEALLKEWSLDSISTITERYNLVNHQAARITAIAARLGVRAAALEILIKKRLEADDSDGIIVNGYTWSENVEPLPVCEDPDAIVKYFKEHEMEDQLALNKGELANRLKNFVKDEALNNELEIVTVEVDDPEAPGGKRETTEVRSKIPGVKVFLKSKLSRVKSSKGAK
jgi:hypothetical protein